MFASHTITCSKWATHQACKACLVQVQDLQSLHCSTLAFVHQWQQNDQADIEVLLRPKLAALARELTALAMHGITHATKVSSTYRL